MISAVPVISLDLSYIPLVNLALQQNHVPIIRKLTLLHDGASDLQDITITITGTPAFIVPWQQRLDVLQKGTLFSCEGVALQSLTSFFTGLTERITGHLELVVSSGASVIDRQHYPISLLPFDQWQGITVLPELLTSFITPNHPQLPAIIRRAAVILGEWTDNPSFDAYQSQQPDRTRKQMAALYEAIAELQIMYCTVPASFEETGQRVRLTDAILNHQLANCLDLSLLYASCIEAIGLHPLIMITKGHAFAGAWLVPECFPDAVNDDPSLLTKRAAEGINEIAWVECTGMNAGQQKSFDQAVQEAGYNMAQTKDFDLFIDVKRARFAGIHPLPLLLQGPEGQTLITDVVTQRNIGIPDALSTTLKIQDIDKVVYSKQKLWERKLLDLTLRNYLLNIRITKSMVQFIGAGLYQLEDKLAEGKEFHILPKPADWDNPLRDAGIYRHIHAADPIQDLIRQEIGQCRLRAYLSEQELNVHLLHLYRSSKLAIEENGANTLYIALGLLKWYETTSSQRPRFAPILLIPVEIIKKSARKGFTIRSREEETMINITLLEMLRQDFGINIGGLEILPRDESGVDVKAVFNVLRQGIMAQPRWDIEEQALLGAFSFSKFILWNDIHSNAAILQQNKIVASLISGKLEWQPEAEIPLDKNPDKMYHPADWALPISTDSSQLDAIVQSAQDRSFVLHGPPGTGKSQTITNIIANALYHGKRVLFVAAKKAALEVVHHRLASIGLSPFCLELHSNKSKKSAILAQLKRATEVTRVQAPEQFKADAERLYTLRNELNNYIQAVHHKQISGYSLYDLIHQYGLLPEGPDHVLFPATDLNQLSPQQWVLWTDIAEEMQAVGIICGHPFQHPLSGVTVKQYSRELKNEATRLLQEQALALQTLGNMSQAVPQLLQLKVPLTKKVQTLSFQALIELLLSLSDIPGVLMEVEHPEQQYTQLITFAEHGQRRDYLKEKLLTACHENIGELDAVSLLHQWQNATGKWFLPRWLQQRKMVNLLKRYRINGNITQAEIPVLLQQVIDYREEQDYVDKADKTALGFLWQQGACKWQQLITDCHVLLRINRTMVALTGLEGLKDWRILMAKQFTEGSKLFMDQHRPWLLQFLAVNKQTQQLTQSIQSLLGITDTATLALDNWITECAKTTARILSGMTQLKDWCNWITVKEKAEQAGLQQLIIAYESGMINSEDVVLQFKKGLYRSAADHIMDRSPELASFNGKLFEEKISKFTTLHQEFQQLTRQETYARLAAAIPVFTQEAAQSSEIGILQKAIRNNGRALSIRKLFDTIPNVLSRLSPCMLMSPISAAQYFDAGSTPFDLVIFDEASQMPTCEAVGAIARGRNVIVVGDPKQMPPTSFFSVNNIDEDNIEMEDLESILDDCLALSMPSQYLLWHYRSKHESLIAFSNATYYENKLRTFPSTDDLSTKVQAVHIPGYYDKGKTRQNKSEAEAIVAEIVHRLGDPVLSKRSIGVVTFSVVQQILIEDMLNATFQANPDLERIAMESEEPLFVKNLENVQGDERDVILFSVGYGPDETGKVSLNFGPVNREGGWRRLNVAVSRARYEMKVFATLRSDQIDLGRTASEGVAGLKAFLAYAEKGKNALPNTEHNRIRIEPQVEQLIANAIIQAGFKVHTHIGSSVYRIDIGVLDPRQPDKYLLGILCDGKSYHAARTMQDRELVQTDVLKLLGWKLHRVWSVDWWENPDATLQGILHVIEAALNTEEPLTEKTPVMSLAPAESTRNSIPLQDVHDIITALPKAVIKEQEVYRTCILKPAPIAGADSLMHPANTEIVIRQMLNVLHTESPISKSLLCRRILTAWRVGRMGSRLQLFFEQQLNQLSITRTQYGVGEYLWKTGQQPETFTAYRIPENEALRREADDLPPEEIAAAIKQVLTQQISLSYPDLLRETAKIFGYLRIGAVWEAAIERGLEIVLYRGWGTREDGRIHISK